MKKNFSTAFALAMAAWSCLSASTAHATLYSYSQPGFDEGATISGTFNANDPDNSGNVVGGSLFPSLEITEFFLSFSGNSLVPAFAHNLSDLTVLVYNPGSAFLGDEIVPNQEAVGSNWFGVAGFSYASGIGAGGFGGSVSDIATGAISYSDELVRVSAVPAPSISWLVVSALPGFVGYGQRSRRPLVS